MNSWIRRLASLKIAVGLLGVVLVALGAGTIVESTHGTEAARGAVYDALWFRVLLGLLALNVLASIVERWPWGRARVGFLLTHGALLVILVGAITTALFKVEGRIPIWEGESAGSFVTPDHQAIALPFAIRLEAFEIDTYPGTNRPAMFRSRVVVEDPLAGRTFAAVIEMNRELAHGGYRFFQSSYNQTPERDQTILAVARDPGQPIVFAGYTLLLIGMITVLGTRIRARMAMPAPVSGISEAARRVAAVFALIALAPIGASRAAPVPDESTVERLRRLPIQHDGRVVPLDTLAREAVWNVTGRSTWRGQDPVAVVLGWTFDPDAWVREPAVKLGGSAVAAACGVVRIDHRAAFLDLVRNRCVLDLIEKARVEAAQNRPLTGTLLAASKLEARLVWMQSFLRQSSYALIPNEADLNAAWSVPAPMGQVSDLMAFLDRPSPAFPTRAAIDREVAYNRIRPSRVAWWILLAATVVALAAWSHPRRWLDVASLLILGAGFVVMTWGILTRWSIAGRIPAANMYESLLFLGWGVALFALVALAFLRVRLVVLNAAAMSALTMALADLLPVDRFVHPVPPVLAGTYWLAVHVPIIMVSYSVLALGVFVAHMQIGLEIFAPARRDLSARMNDMLYWYIHVGSILLIAGILTGSIWAASSWGRYWGWDPKEVWSLVAFLAYVAILHGRFDRWLGPFGVAAASIAAFWMILMTYLGVNFVLATGLHAYGFGSSTVLDAMLSVAAIEIVFVTVGWIAYRRNRRRTWTAYADATLPARSAV